MPTTEQLDKSTKETITKRKIKRRQVVAEVLDGKLTLAEIGRKHFRNPKYPSQTVTNCVKQPGYQAEIKRQMMDSDISPEYLKGKLKSAIEQTTPKQANHLRGIELGMRANAMLVDRTINDNRNVDLTELVQRAEEAIKSLLRETQPPVGETQIGSLSTEQGAAQST